MTACPGYWVPRRLNYYMGPRVHTAFGCCKTIFLSNFLYHQFLDDNFFACSLYFAYSFKLALIYDTVGWQSADVS